MRDPLLLSFAGKKTSDILLLVACRPLYPPSSIPSPPPRTSTLLERCAIMCATSLGGNMQSNSSSRKVIPWHMQSRIKTELALNGEDPAQPERPEQRQEEAHARHATECVTVMAGPPPPLRGFVIVLLLPPLDCMIVPHPQQRTRRE